MPLSLRNLQNLRLCIPDCVPTSPPMTTLTRNRVCTVPRDRSTDRSGLTLVELLIVISIMAILTALIVPQVRTVNKDRNLRETARVIGTAFASARDRAVADGSAGILIRRNPNFLFDANGAIAPPIEYASMTLYQMRRLPPYTGEYSDSTAVLQIDGGTGQYYTEIDEPFDTGLVNPGDTIYFNDAPLGFEIDSIVPSPNTGGYGQPLIRVNLNIVNINGMVAYGGNLIPPPPVNIPMRFRIERAPQIIQSTEVTLPEGYYIDLRYSGPLDGLDDDTNPATLTKFSLQGDNSDLLIFFGSNGGIDRIQFNGLRVRLGGALYLLVNEYDPADAVAGLDASAMASRILAKSNALWVTIGEQTGGVSIGYNSPPSAAAVTDFQKIQESRTLSRNRSNALQ